MEDSQRDSGNLQESRAGPEVLRETGRLSFGQGQEGEALRGQRPLAFRTGRRSWRVLLPKPSSAP